MSKLGKLHAEISVDGGAQKSHYGSSDPVTGQVVLSYGSYTNMLMKKTDTPDLFGPLRIKITVHGKVIVKARHERELSTHHCTDLFHKSFTVHEGPFKAQAGNTYSFPWSFCFPEDARPIVAKTWIPTPTATLPPSFGIHFYASPNLVNVQVCYTMQLEVIVGGINVKTSVPREDSWPILKYDLPRPPRISTATFTERKEIQSDPLSNIDRRFSGLRDKLKVTNMSAVTPSLSLDIICTEHRQIYPGQLLTYRIKLSYHELNSTGSSIPNATLEHLRVELLATTTVNTSERMIGSRECVDRRTLQKFVSHRALPAMFSDTDDNTIDVVLDYVDEYIMSSFAHREVTRSYKLRIELQLKVANKIVRVNRDCAVTVVPPPSGVDVAVTEPLAGMAQAQLNIDDDLPPPAYEEVTAGSSRGAQGPDEAQIKAAPPYKAFPEL